MQPYCISTSLMETSFCTLDEAKSWEDDLNLKKILRLGNITAYSFTKWISVHPPETCPCPEHPPTKTPPTPTLTETITETKTVVCGQFQLCKTEPLEYNPAEYEPIYLFYEGYLFPLVQILQLYLMEK